MNKVSNVIHGGNFWLNILSVPAKRLFVTFFSQAILNALVLIKNQDYEN